MPLKLVTGPANAAKAGAVLGGLRAELDAEPVLVVPAFEDVEHNQRELAARGAVFGARVLRFRALFREIAARAGWSARVASPLQRELLLEQAIRALRPRVLAESAQRPGFARAAARLIADVERASVAPDAFARALSAWAGRGPRRAYAHELAELYRRYREQLDEAGLVDADLFAAGAVDALAAAPGAWGRTPVFAYGFDDFTPLELRALEVLARDADAQVVVSLPYEAGRVAFRALAGVHARLAEIADGDERALPARDEHYARGSRAALHALERNLFEDAPATADPGDAVRVQLAGGRRAEVELVAAELLALLRAGTTPGDVAVVMRDPRAYASTVEQVFGAYGIPYAIDRSVRLAHTGLGRGLLALLRCALGRGDADDLLAYLRTPGRTDEAGHADRLEVELRRRGAADLASARRLWDERIGPAPLREIDLLAGLAARPVELLDALADESARLLAGPHRRTAPILVGPEVDDARALAAVRAALGDLRALARTGSALDAERVHDTLAGLRVRVGERPQPGRVLVASPLDVRARRFEAVLVCGLQQGELPAAARADPFLSDRDRAAIARASGGEVVLPRREDRLERERYLFYVCASRAERLLVLSARSCGEEGEPEPQSSFLDDVERVLPGLRARARRRSLADVTWTPQEAPTVAEWERALAALQPAARPRGVGPVERPAALAALGERAAVSASALERFAGCPVSWLVEDVLRPVALEPDPEQVVQGAYAHRVLELTFARLRERTGDRRVTPANLDQAELILLEALEQEGPRYLGPPGRARVRAGVRRLEFELLRHLRYESELDTSFEPDALELAFGGEGEPAVELAGGLRVRGRIDRVDRNGDVVAVRDYKRGRVADYSARAWRRKGRLQAALYMLVAERLLGVEAVAGLYTPLAGTDRRSRGAVSAEWAAALGGDFVAGDVLAEDELAELRAWADAEIGAAAACMRAGTLCSQPDSCAYRGGCSHPSICRIEA